ncbi:MAG: YihY/virulence factor BrkB family protein, partial [Terracidiphilus sp.]
MSRDNILVLTAGVAFYVFVAIPSGLAAVVSIYGLIFNPADVQHQSVWLVGLLPADVLRILTNFLAMLAARQPSTLGFRMFVGLLIALWSAQSASSSMITALNAVYERTERRGFLQFQLAAIGLAVCSIIFATLSLLLFASVQSVLAHVPLATGTKWVISFFRWPALAVLVAFAISGIYRFAPANGGSQNWGLWGVALTTIVWVGSSVLFGVYVARVASYDTAYGPLGAIVVLLLWLYIAVLVVLLGAEFNAELDE